MSDAAPSYFVWRFNVWHEARELSYDQIDRLVDAGAVKPGASADDVLKAHRAERLADLRRRNGGE